MKSNWTFTRVLYLVMGGIIITQSINSQEWLGIALGSYFASMGIFAFGCASGSCFGGNCYVETKTNTSIHDVRYKRAKTKDIHPE